MGYNFIFWSLLKQFYNKKKHARASKNNGRVVFENKGRSGYAIYNDGTNTVRFYTELGGGKCIFYIGIPSEEQWEKQTGFSLQNRISILTYIAEEALKIQIGSPGSFYKINEKNIGFYHP